MVEVLESRARYQANAELYRTRALERYYANIEGNRERMRERARDKHIRVCQICGVDLRGTGKIKWCVACTKLGRRVTRKYWDKVGRFTFSRGSDWNIQKYRAIARDGHKCRCCGRTEAQIKTDKAANNHLVVHHIHEYAGRPEDNRLENLVTLCNSCHLVGRRFRVFYWI